MNAFRRLRDEDSGLSMAELVVTMLIATVLLSLVANMFVATTQSTRQANMTREAATTAGNIANQVSTAIRFASRNPVAGGVVDPAVVQATASSVTLITVLDSNSRSLAPTMVRYSVVNGQWREERWAATTSGGLTTFPANPRTSRILGGLAVTQASPTAQPFVYLDDSGAEVAPASNLTATQRNTISRIRITVAIQSQANAPVTFIQNTVDMPNLSYAAGIR